MIGVEALLLGVGVSLPGVGVLLPDVGVLLRFVLGVGLESVEMPFCHLLSASVSGLSGVVLEFLEDPFLSL